MGIDVSTLLTNFGALGVVVLLVTGVLVPGWAYKRLEHENETYRDALQVERQRNADLQQFAAAGQKARFVGSPDYGPDSLRDDLARFRSLLGLTDGEGVFTTDQP